MFALHSPAYSVHACTGMKGLKKNQKEKILKAKMGQVTSYPVSRRVGVDARSGLS